MHQSKVISPRVTTKDLVTTLFAHNLSTTAVMLNLQVLEDNVDPEKNKTKHTYRIFIQTYIDVHSSVANWSSGQIFITSIQISLIIFLFFILGFQKRIASICLKKIHKGYMFLKA